MLLITLKCAFATSTLFFFIYSNPVSNMLSVKTLFINTSFNACFFKKYCIFL